MDEHIERAFARRDGLVRAARAQGDGRAALGAHHAVPRPRGRRARRRRLRRDDRHRGRHRDPRRAEGAGSRSCACSPTTFPARSRTSTALSTYTFVNQAFANWVRLPQDEIYGKTPFEVLAPDVASFLRPILKRAQGGEHVEYERVGSHARRRAALGARPRSRRTSTPTARLRGLYCTEYDIHDLKRTEQALAAREEQLRLFTDNIPEPVVYLDTDRRYAFVNEAFLQLNGLDRAAVIGKTTADVIGLEATTALAPYQDRAFAGETVIYERALVDATGRIALDPRPDGAGSPDRRRDPGRLRRRCHDITDLKRRRTRWRRARASCARSWTACRRRSPTSTATSAASTSTARSCSTSGSTAGAGRRRCGCATSSGTASTRARRRCSPARSKASRPRSTGWSRAPTASAAG